jgi:hypothetical protein
MPQLQCPSSFDPDIEYDPSLQSCSGYSEHLANVPINEGNVNPKTKFYTTLFFAIVIPAVIALCIFIIYLLKNEKLRSAILPLSIGPVSYPVSVPGIIGTTIALPPMSYIYILVMTYKYFFPSGDFAKSRYAYPDPQSAKNAFYDVGSESSVSWVKGPSPDSSMFRWILYGTVCILQLILAVKFFQTAP